MKAIICNRCKEFRYAEGEIGVNLDIYSIRITSGVIKAPASLGVEYFQLEFKEDFFNVTHLCVKCFDDFMNIKKEKSNINPPETIAS